METTNIYILIDPITQEVRYVGKANNITQRYKAHLNRARKHQIHKKNWINSLKKQGVKPLIEVIDVVPISEWIFWETYWISQFKVWGFDLINYTLGGDGCTFGNQTSFKKGEGGVKIVCLEKDGTYVKTFDSIKAAENSTHKRGIFSVINKKTKTSGGYIWLYEKEYEKLTSEMIKNVVDNANIKKKPISSTQFQKGHVTWNKNIKGYKNTKRYKPIIQYTKNGDIVKEWKCVDEIVNEFHVCPDTIRNCCLGKSITSQGFIWRYK